MQTGKTSSTEQRKTRFTLLLVALFGCAALSYAEHTRYWRQSTYDEFMKGAATGVAVRSDGHLELAPKFALLAEADASYLWSLKADPSGKLYAAAGTPAKVFRFDGQAKPVVVFESTELSAQSIAFDAKGTMYVATSPDGKVYRVGSAGERTEFFDPKTKYIWEIAFGPDGKLYVATGDKGQIFAVSPDGKSELFYASDEAHIKVMAFDAKGNLIAGTEPNGRVIRISRDGAKNAKDAANGAASGFVLYETPKREVTALAIAADGNLYASAIGEKTRPNPTSRTSVIATGGGTTVISGDAVTVTQVGAPFNPFPQGLTSGIYRIAPDGSPEEVWSSRDELVYALGVNNDGRLLAGTGNSGALLVIDGQGVYAQLAKSGASQITGIARGGSNKVYICTANPGKVFTLGPEFEAQGTYESQPFDAKLFSQWGRITWWGPPATTSVKAEKSMGQPRLEFFVRSGNTEDPGREWSAWSGPYAESGAQVSAPSARFMQWKAVIHDGRPGDGIDWVSVAYQPRNVAPMVDSIVMQDPGVRAQGQNILAGQPATVALKMPQAPSPLGVVITSTSTPKFDQPPQGTMQKGYQSVVWSAHDDNEDDLRYAVYFRGENERDWKLLKDNLEQKYYSWDSTAMPDGAYYLRIVASDAPSNPPAAALQGSREGERFVVDNTPPVIEKLQVSPTGMNADRSLGVSYDFTFTANDATSAIEKAQYSLDGGEWTLLAPTNGISDSRTENYAFTLRGLHPGEHTIAVRAFDRFENVGAAKTTFTIAN